MYINMESKKYSIREFLTNEDVRQGVVTLKNIFSDNKQEHFLYKLKEKSGATSIFFNRIITDNQISAGYDRLEFLLSIDKENKIIIYTKATLIDVEEELLSFKSDYAIWNNAELSTEGQKTYKKRIKKKIKESLPVVRQSKEYKQFYNDYLEQYKDNIRRCYLGNPNMGDFELYFSEISRLFPISDLEILQRLLKSDELMDQLVTEGSQQKLADVKQLAELEAKNQILQDLRDNPDGEIKLSLEIRKAAEQGGKTLNIITKDNKTVKVENSLSDGMTFRTTVGWEYINIEDIEEIVFSRKTLFKAK